MWYLRCCGPDDLVSICKASRAFLGPRGTNFFAGCWKTDVCYWYCLLVIVSVNPYYNMLRRRSKDHKRSNSHEQERTHMLRSKKIMAIWSSSVNPYVAQQKNGAPGGCRTFINNQHWSWMVRVAEVETWTWFTSPRGKVCIDPSYFAGSLEVGKSFVRNNSWDSWFCQTLTITLGYFWNNNCRDSVLISWPSLSKSKCVKRNPRFCRTWKTWIFRLKWKVLGWKDRSTVFQTETTMWEDFLVMWHLSLPKKQHSIPILSPLYPIYSIVLIQPRPGTIFCSMLCSWTAVRPCATRPGWPLGLGESTAWQPGGGLVDMRVDHGSTFCSHPGCWSRQVKPR